MEEIHVGSKTFGSSRKSLSVGDSVLAQCDRIDPVTTDIVGEGEFRSTSWAEPMVPLPTKFNQPFEEPHILWTEVSKFTVGREASSDL